ncbi:MAG: alpha/beta hydrolase fold [Caulobacteraceae bacterium]|jgi:hypothetical protein|nr:alpha/beta hydrolase fold [Caulobacteraceae bacterium]
MAKHSHQTAPTQFVDAAGVRFAYRRFGKSGGVPLVFNMHFTGTMDHWDPMVTYGLAATRERGEPGCRPVVSEAVPPAPGGSRPGGEQGGRAGAFDYLRDIDHPTLVINRNNDVIV